MNRKLLSITVTLAMLSTLTLAAPALAETTHPVAEIHIFLPPEEILSVECQSSLEIPSITPESPTTVEVENTHIHELTINVNEEVSNVRLIVQQLVENFENLSTKFAAEGEVGEGEYYQNGVHDILIDISISRAYRYFRFIPEGISDAQIENVIIEFEVERSWISEHSIDEESITFGRFDQENMLEVLPTTRLGEDTASHIYFTSTSPSLSYFAIVGVGEEGPSENVSPSENVQFSNLQISPESVSPEEPVTISVDVTNLGENQATCPVTLRINGVLKDSETVTLDGGETETVEFTVTEGTPGTYDVEVDGQTGSFEVIEHEEGEPSGAPVLGIVMMAIVAVSVVVLLYGRRKWT